MKVLQKSIISSILILGISISLFFVVFATRSTPVNAAINQTMNFQGRLLNSQGAVVPDGYYNIEFKIYEGGTGTAAGNPSGTLVWTEDHINNASQGVLVQNGYMSVTLGSITSLSSVDWDNDTLWLSLNIGNTNTTCTPFSSCSGDGEMLPMKRLTASPYAMNSALLGGMSNSDFIQLAQGVQTDASTVDAIAINKTSTGNFLNFQKGGTGVLSVGNAGDITFGNNADHTISVATSASGTGNNLTISAGSAFASSGANGGDLLLVGGTKDGAGANGGVVVKAPSGDSGHTFQVQNAAGTPLLTADTTNNLLQVGSSVANTNENLLVLNNFSLATDPTNGTNGAMYYNTSMKVYRCYTDGAWVNCAKAGGLGGTGDANKVAFFNSSGNIQTNGQFAWDDSAGTLTVGVPAVTTYSVGSTGPAGGVIFYDKGNNSGGWRFLEAAPTDATSGSWGCSGNNISTSTSIGDGDQNTTNIIAAGCTTSSNAANIADAYSTSGYNDWFLPSKDEMNQMYLQKSYLSGYGSGWYQTSTQQSTTAAYVQSLSTGAVANGNKTWGYSVRPIRKVAGTTNTGLFVDTASTRVGIGTSAPGYKLDVDGGTGITARFSGRVIGGDAVNSNEFMTLGQANNGFVQLQSTTPGTAQTGNLNITGSALASTIQGSTSVLTPLLDTSTAVALNIGTTNATGINLNQAVTIAANKNLSFASGTGTFDQSASSGTFKTGTGDVSLNGNTTIASSKTLTANGNTLVKTNSATALQVQNASATPQLTVNTSNNLVQIGSASANANQNLLVLNNYNSATDPTNGTNGAMYYNTTSNTFRCYKSGAWGDCTGSIGSFVNFAPSSVQADSSSNNTIFINKTGSGNIVRLQSSGTDAFVINNSGDLSFGNNADHNISVATSASGAGKNLTVTSGTAGSGNSNGGNLTLQGGAGAGTGATGSVVLGTPTFKTTANDANCYTGGALVASSCTIATSSVDNAAGVIVGFSQETKTATLPNPTITTPGKVTYIIAANGSSDFTLVVNGGGAGNEIAMRQNTTATMVWSGSKWTAAGASSSTTLQAAYDNTLQSAGGAELVVAHTSNTNGLTIRDSVANPVNGPLLSVQTNSAATLFSINSNVNEYSSDSGAETAGSSSSTFPASTWSAIGSASVSRYTAVGDYIATGQASTQIATTATANDGVKNTLSEALTAGQHYNVSFSGRLASGSFTDLYVYYSADGSTQSVACPVSRNIITSAWTKINCSFTAPASGITSSNAILIGQTGATARTFYADNLSVTIAADYNYATDGGVDDGGTFATNWPAAGAATVTRDTGVGNDAGDSAKVVTTGINQGVSNKLAVAPLPSTLYLVTAYSASTTTGFNSFTVKYTPDGGSTSVPCVDYSTQAISDTTSSFTKVTCYIKTAGTTVTNPRVDFTQADATARTFYVDTFSMTLATNTTPNIQIGGGQNGGPTTLFTLDSSASAPIASNNAQMLGSMYYDTSLGKIQCYEATGWGSCGSASNTIVTISPEYTNAVLHGNGVGTMTSDICSSTLGINDGSGGQPTICSSGETYNFYKWTSPQASAQTYSIYVTYQLPTSFNSFLPAGTSLMGRTDSTNSTVAYTVYKENTSGLSACGSTLQVSTGSVSSWQVEKAEGAADPSTCGFAPSDSIVFKIDTTASQNADAYVGNLNFTFTNK